MFKQAIWAPGIPDKSNFGVPTKSININDMLEYVLQHHQTHRVPKKPHYDLRLGNKDTGLFSWAVPGAAMPEPGKKKLVIQQPIHAFDYRDFTGNLGKGYGHGVVQMADRGKALITNVTPNTISFTLAHGKVPIRYTLINMKTEKGTDWLLINKPLAKSVTGVGDKPKILPVRAENLDAALAQADEVQAKIDGASTIYTLGSKGIEAYGVNPSVEGKPIVHTERLGLHNIPVPKGLEDTVLRGEAFGTREGKTIPFQELSGILNSTILKSIETQKAKNIKLQNALFDIIRYRGENAPSNYNQKKQILEDISKQLSAEKFILPDTAKTPEEAKKLLSQIETGNNPLTQEGVILRMPTGKTLKFKFRPDATVYLAGTYPGTGKRKTTAGGLTFSNEPGGEATGRAGTGFSDEQLKEIITNLGEYRGKPMRITHQGQFGSGKYRAPAFAGFETDKPILKTAVALSKLAVAFFAYSTMQKEAQANTNNSIIGNLDKLVNITKNYEFPKGKIPTKQTGTNTFYKLPVEMKINKAGKRYWPWSTYMGVPVTNFPSSKHLYVSNTNDWNKAIGKQYETYAARDKLNLPSAIRRFINTSASDPSNTWKQRTAEMSNSGVTWPVTAVNEYWKKPGAEAKEAVMTKTIETDLIPLEIIKGDGTKKELKIEMADTDEKRRKGLSKRSSLAENQGMLFDKAGAMWMKDCLIPLDIAFITKCGTIVDIKHMAVVDDKEMFKPLYISNDSSAKYALEMNANWFKQNNINIGDNLCLKDY